MKFDTLVTKKIAFNGSIFLVGSLVMTSVIFAFCILTNSSGDYRDYARSNLPFQYYVCDQTPQRYLPSIEASGENWNRVLGCYFTFAYAGSTTVSTLGRDGTNLIFFDAQGMNFQPNTSTIAFSSTFTSNIGGNYRATESDLIYNARDYPPSTVGDPNQMDLEGILTHELGHHMGIAHFGEAGSPPGCGESIPAATMYGVVAPGDTTKRSLHPHDIAAARILYPEWRLSVDVRDSITGNPIGLSKIHVPGHTIIYTTAPEGSECPGFIVSDSVSTDESGWVSFVPDADSLTLFISAFGYQPDTAIVLFHNPDSIPGTESIRLQESLLPARQVVVNGSLSDTVSQSEYRGHVSFYASHDPRTEPFYETDTDSLGEFSATIPPDHYTVTVQPEYPYPSLSFETDLYDSSNILSVYQDPAQVLYIYKDYTSTKYEKMEKAFPGTGYTYYFWDAVHLDSLPPDTALRQLSEPRIVVWSTGDVVTSVLDSTEQSYLTTFLDAGGRLLLSGTNLAWRLSDSVLFRNYIHVKYTEKSSQLLMKSVFADDPITQGGFAGYSQGIMPADLIMPDSTHSVTPVLQFLSSDGYGMIRISDGNYNLIFASFGIEHLIDNNPSLLNLSGLMQHALDYLAGEPVITENQTDIPPVPATFSVSRNYPNPFNPSTQFQYTIPKPALVSIAIYDISGRKIKTLLRSKQAAGHYQAIWDGANEHGIRVSSGVYFLEVRAGRRFRHLQKMILLR